MEKVFTSSRFLSTFGCSSPQLAKPLSVPFADSVLVKGFELYKNMYKRIGKISEQNIPVVNEYNFLNYLELNKTGLKIMKGSENTEECSASKKGDNKNEIIEEKYP
ncbi:Uncharacterised protein [Chryseobacterium taklimakanense]|uniref:Uncharacterized protein n=1 Tax=Chryseobacterium taklimakanense TaxID=536441 RepID=A0A239WDJ9_9FLAO|nr:hypothetical protein [Chryseobacterium taklimakanense]SNV32279.1 Uncharacterised protein [Chryseobacterium taklimakanense]